MSCLSGLADLLLVKGLVSGIILRALLRERAYFSNVRLKFFESKLGPIRSERMRGSLSLNLNQGRQGLLLPLI
jgi:hypothetical protein